jgi:hypothetical protein
MLFLIMAAAVQLPSVPQAPVPIAELTAQQVIERAVARMAANALAREGLEYTKTLAKSGGDTETARMWIADGEVWQTRVSKNGRAVKPGKAEHPKFDFLTGITDRYHFSFASASEPRRTGDGAECWVLKFEPRANLSSDSLEEDIANRLTGTMWIDAHGYWVRKAEGRLTKPFRKALVSVIEDVSFGLTQTEVLGAVMLRSIALTFHYSFFGSGSTEQWKYDYGDWRVTAPDATAAPR